MNNIIELPKDINAEMAVLGCMIQYSDAIEEILKELSSIDFFSVQNRAVFDVITEMAQETAMIDLVTISSAMERKNLLPQIGGYSYLTALIDKIADRANLSYYIKLVKDKSLVRQLLQGTKKIEESTRNDNDVDEIIKQAEKIIYDIAEKKVSIDFVHISEVTDLVLQEIEDYKNGVKDGIGIASGFPGLDAKTMGFNPP